MPMAESLGAANADPAAVRQVVSDVINGILAETSRATRVIADEDALVATIGLDSLDLAVMTVRLEQQFGNDPFRQGQRPVRTFGELLAVYEQSLRGEM